MPNAIIPAAATGLPSRRATLATLAGLGAALSLPEAARAAAPAPVVPDPTFALIEQHRAAYAVFDAAVGEWSGKVGRPSPEGQARLDATHEAELAALDALLTPEPTTLAGICALAEYVLEYESRMIGGDEWDNPTWALATIAEACRKLIPTGGAA